MIMLLTITFSLLAYVSPLKSKTIYYIIGMLLIAGSLFRAYAIVMGVPFLILGVRTRKIFYNLNTDNTNE